MIDEANLHSLAQGAVITHLRSRLGLRQGELADRAGLTISMMSRMEKGQARIDTLVLGKLATALQVEPADVLRRVGQVVTETESAARLLIKPLGKNWDKDVLDRVGAEGLAALITFVSAVVVGDKAPRKRLRRAS